MPEITTNHTTPSIQIDSPTSPATKPIKNSNSIPRSAPEVGLFADDLVSPSIAASLPETYSIRSVQRSDYGRGFLDVLRVLTTVGDVTEEQWSERYEWMNTQGKGGYYVLCILDGDRVVGTGALIVERKLYVFISILHSHDKASSSNHHSALASTTLA